MNFINIHNTEPYLVSIITPSYNSEKFISMTIDSVLRQTYRNWEMIIVDDASTDNTCTIIYDYCKKDNRIKLIRLKKNSGAAVARNRAIEKSKGKYIAFLDSDDIWLPEKLKIQVEFMLKNKHLFTYSAYKKIDEYGIKIGIVGVPEKISYNGLLKTCVIGCLTAVYDAEMLGKIPMPLIEKRQDFGLWLKILKKIKFAYGIKEPLALYRVRHNSISSNKKNAAFFTWKVYRNIERLNIIISIYYFTHYAIKGILRTKFPRIAKFLGVLDC